MGCGGWRDRCSPSRRPSCSRSRVNGCRVAASPSGPLARTLALALIFAALGYSIWPTLERSGSAPARAVAGAAASQSGPIAGAASGALTVLAVVDGAGAPGGGLREPNGVVVDDDEYLYVADTANGRVVKFDRSGRFVAAWTGQGEGALTEPIDLTIGPGGHLYVLDRATGYIQAFTPDGRPVARIAGPDAGLYAPFGIGASGDALFLADTGNARVLKYS